MREDLEAALDAAPRDAAAFLVYADWLLEHAEPQGELIRVQHALAQAPGDLTLSARDEQLRKQLLPALPDSRWELGFPRHVTLTWVSDDDFPWLYRALRSPLCRFLEGATLTDYVTPARVLEPLAELPRLEDVTVTGSLELISPRSLVKMTEHVLRLPRLKRLTLQARQVTEALDKLASLPLSRLTLSGAWLGTADVQVLKRVRERMAPGCELRLQQLSLSFDVERLLGEAWPFEAESSSEPGLLVEEPEAERGRYLLVRDRKLRIGSAFACDLSISHYGLRPVHFLIDGASYRSSKSPERGSGVSGTATRSRAGVSCCATATTSPRRASRCSAGSPEPEGAAMLPHDAARPAPPRRPAFGSSAGQ